MDFKAEVEDYIKQELPDLPEKTTHISGAAGMH